MSRIRPYAEPPLPFEIALIFNALMVFGEVALLFVILVLWVATGDFPVR